MENGDFQSIRRLLRQAFSEILTLSDRLVALEDRSGDATTPTTRTLDFSGVVDLNAGLTYQHVNHLDNTKTQLLDAGTRSGIGNDDL